MPEHLREPFQTRITRSAAGDGGLGQGAGCLCLIHADMYPENVLFKTGEAYPIDFEDCGFGLLAVGHRHCPVPVALD